VSELSALAQVIAEQKEQINQLELDIDLVTRRAERYEVQFNQARDTVVMYMDQNRTLREEVAYLTGELAGFIDAMDREVAISHG
jgi:hypothetical protein